MRILWAFTSAIALSATLAAFISQAPPSSSSSAAVCALFSMDDAQKIMGGAMLPKPNMGATVCMYQLTEGYGTAALTVVISRDAPSEDRAWASIKEVRHLQADQKNTKPILSIGDEAWFTGAISKGKAGASSIIVRKGHAHFAIDVMTLEYRASPEQMTAIAKRIASQL